MAKEIIDRGDVARLSVLVDNGAAKENVSRFLARMGYEVSLSEEGGAFEVTGAKGESAAACEVMEEPEARRGESRIAVLVGTDRMGTGDDMLGRKLIVSFIGTLKEMGPALMYDALLPTAGPRASVVMVNVNREPPGILSVCGNLWDPLHIFGFNDTNTAKY